MDSEYEAAKARALARRDGERQKRRIEFRARLVLGEAGWRASRTEIAAAAAAHEQVSDDEREAVIARAIEMQVDERYAGRRLSPEADVGKPILTTEARDRLHGWIREHRDMPFPDAYRAARKAFDLPIGTEAFRYHWNRVRQPSKNGTAPKPVRPEPARPKPTPAVVEAEPETLVEARTASDAESVFATLEEVPEPLVAVEPLSPGRVRVRIWIETDLAAGMAIAQAAAGAIARSAGARS